MVAASSQHRSHINLLGDCDLAMGAGGVFDAANHRQDYCGPARHSVLTVEYAAEKPPRTDRSSCGTSWRSFLKQDYAAVPLRCWQLKPVALARVSSSSSHSVSDDKQLSGYECFGQAPSQPVCVIPSCSLGADHRRSRSRDQHLHPGYVTSDDDADRHGLPTWRQYRQRRYAQVDEPAPQSQVSSSASTSLQSEQPACARPRAPWQADPLRRSRRSPQQREQLTMDRNRRARQQLRRRYYRHRLNSSDDVVGIESASESTDSDRLPRWVDTEEQQAGFGREAWRQQHEEEMQTAAYQHDDAEDGHSLATVEGRRARRLEHLAYRHYDVRSPVREVAG